MLLPLPLPQAQHLLHTDGLFVGSSAAMNCVGAVKLARQLGPGHTIVTILCDAGHRCALLSVEHSSLGHCLNQRCLQNSTVQPLKALLLCAQAPQQVPRLRVP